jgi:hypothetical protein
MLDRLVPGIRDAVPRGVAAEQITAIFALVLADRQARYGPLDHTRDHVPTIARGMVSLVNRREAKDLRGINVLTVKARTSFVG